MPTPRRREPRHALKLALVAAATSVVVIVAGGQSASGVGQGVTVRWQGLVGGPRPRVTNGQRMIVVLVAPSLAERVAGSGGLASDAQEQAWTRAAAESQRALVFKLGVQGVRIRREQIYTRVLNGFSATLDPRGVGLLERDPGVVGVFPVRTAYPADDSSTPKLGPTDAQIPTVSFQRFDGRGVTIALLDTGVERNHPLISSRILDGVDVVGGDPLATPASKPDGTGEVERHGTQMAGILVGDGGPGGMRGIAPGAAIVPIRVAGWQRDAQGDWGVYARTDQLVAGLERAVDPNADGDAHDAARIALAALAEPFGAFADGPLARAAEGALALDTLVVAPAGNDGVAGVGYGSLSGPGGAPGALTVGAVDLRGETDEVRVVLRAGLDVVFDRVVPLGGAIAPKEALSLAVAVPPAGTPAQAVPGQPAAANALARYFDANGYSTVAGRAALVPAGEDPSATVAAAARAGARAVLLYGEQLPAGAFGFDESASVPVVGLPPAAARALRDAVAAGASAGVGIGAPRTVDNAATGHVAPFSSTGLAFDGRVKPDLVAPGVGIGTADAGEADDSGEVRYATVNGTSASAAVVAGAAALLAQARPSLDARELKSLLVASARPIADDTLTTQGTGLVDVGAAVATELVVSPSSLALGHATKAGWHSRQTVTIQNVSTRPVTLKVDVARTAEGAAPVRFEARPRSITLLRGQGTKIHVTLRVTGAPVGDAPAEGAITVQPVGGSPLRIPWALRFGRARSDLLGTPVFEVPRRQSSEHAFSPTEDGPAFLYVRAGRVDATSAGPEVRPLSRLDIELWTDEGRDMGLLARVRDVIPGQYQFALTGRDPLGNPLSAGTYELRIAGYPTEPGRVSRRTLTFTIE